MALIVPPGGFAGFSQMTAASRMALNKGGTRRASTRKRKRRGSTDSQVMGSQRGRGVRAYQRSQKKKKKKGGSKLKFGSPAWRKKYMKKKR